MRLGKSSVKRLAQSAQTSLLAWVAFTGIALAQQRAGDIEIVPVRGHIYMVAGGGANITISVGPDGILLVDAGNAQMSDKVLAAIRELDRQLATEGRPLKSYPPPKPIRYIANTTIAPDHTGGNEKLSQAGTTFTGGNVSGDIAGAGEGAAILATENALQRMSDAKLPSKMLPTETYFKDVMKLSHFFNGEGVELFHIPAANTDADSIVFFRGSDIIAAGDIFMMTSYPVIDIKKGGSIQGVLAGLNRMIDMSVAEFRTEGGTMVIPGHGRICDLADLTYYRDMVTIIKDRVQDMIKRDMTLAQVKAAKPTEDWDPRFGRNPDFTPEMFVEAIYTGLTQKSQGAAK
jgi:cyclase